MAGLVPASRVAFGQNHDLDAQVKPAHDDIGRRRSGLKPGRRTKFLVRSGIGPSAAPPGRRRGPCVRCTRTAHGLDPAIGSST